MKTFKVVVSLQIEDNEDPLQVVQDCDYIFTRESLPPSVYENENLGILKTEVDTSLPHGMPSLVTTKQTLYSLDELDERVQEKVLESLWSLNVYHDWWDHIYDDAANIGLKITEYDTYRDTISGELTEYLLDSCKLIRKNHDKECETFKTAKAYLDEYIAVFVKWREAKQSSGDQDDFKNWKPADFLAEFKWTDEAEEVEKEYQKALLEDYLVLLRKEYDYQTSAEAVKESIIANEYLFTGDGERAA